MICDQTKRSAHKGTNGTSSLQRQWKSLLFNLRIATLTSGESAGGKENWFFRSNLPQIEDYVLFPIGWCIRSKTNQFLNVIMNLQGESCHCRIVFTKAHSLSSVHRPRHVPVKGHGEGRGSWPNSEFDFNSVTLTVGLLSSIMASIFCDRGRISSLSIYCPRNSNPGLVRFHLV